MGAYRVLDRPVKGRVQVKALVQLVYIRKIHCTASGISTALKPPYQDICEVSQRVVMEKRRLMMGMTWAFSHTG